MMKVIQKVPISEEKIWSKAKDIPCFEYPIFKAIKARPFRTQLMVDEYIGSIFGPFQSAFSPIAISVGLR